MGSLNLIDNKEKHRIRDETKKARINGPFKPILSKDGKPILTSIWCPSTEDMQEYYEVPFYAEIKLTGRTFPYVVRNLIQLYSNEGDTVYDPMMGTGTTLYEGNILKRKVFGSDLHAGRVESFKTRWSKYVSKKLPKIALCSASEIPMPNNSVDLLIMSFPWFSSWEFADDPNNESMDNYKELEEFMQLTEKIYTEIKRVLKPGGFACNILGNTYRKGVYYPITMKSMGIIEKVGLKLWYQFWNMRVDINSIKFPWNRSGIDTVVNKAGNGIAWDIHEDIIVARKPGGSK